MAFTGSSVGEIKERPAAALLDLRGPDEERLAHGAMDELRAAAARMSEAQRVADIGSWEWRVSDDRVTWSDCCLSTRSHRSSSLSLGAVQMRYCTPIYWKRFLVG